MPSPSFLLGAGASAEAGLPLSSGITSKMIGAFAGDPYLRREATALNFVVAAIIHHDSRRGERPDSLPDIERVASAIELLATRSDLEVSPFVSSWDPTVEGLETAPGRSPSFIDRELVDAIRGKGPTSSSPSPRTIVTDLVNSVVKGKQPSSGFDRDLRRAVTSEPDGGKLVRALVRTIDRRSLQSAPLFLGLLNELTRRLVETLQVEDETAFDYLKPLAALAIERARDPILIGTLNYDLGVETMADRFDCTVDRLVEVWADPTHTPLENPQMRLVKLHGSLDWRRTSRWDGLPASSLALASKDTISQKGAPSPFVVFGQREKLRAEGPFLELLEAYRTGMKRSRDLVVIGYGFRDGHINELIARWFNEAPNRRIAIVDPHFPDDSNRWSSSLPDFRSHLRNWQAQEPPVGGLVSNGPEPRIAIIRKATSSFLESIDIQDPESSLDLLFRASTEAHPSGKGVVGSDTVP